MKFENSNSKNPIGSYGYRNENYAEGQTLKGSNVYRKTNDDVYTTPSGSHSLYPDVFYKHQIPSGLIESLEAEIQKGLAELKVLM
ncbi:MAG: hypothetical protein WAZ98_07935 [Cyclobacteriaceae bacterium]